MQPSLSPYSLSAFALGSLVALAASVGAQQSIPSGFLTDAGASYTNYPFGLANSRVQYLYDASLIVPPALPINQLEVRAHPSLTATAHTATIEIRISTSQSAWNAASTTFATNSGNDEVVTFTPKSVNLPGYASSTTPNWPTVFKLDKPFVYIKAKGNLLIDYLKSNGQSTTYPSNVVWNKAVASNTIGTPCKTANQSFTGGAATSTSTTLIFSLTGGPANGAAAQILSFQKLPQSVPLPNGGCPLHVVPFLVFGVATSSTGTASVTYPTPVGTRSLTGPVVYSQWVGLGATWDSSPAIEVTIGGYLPCCRIYNTSSATATTGSVQIGAGIVHKVL
ncbi:MAG: hypothetical protein KDC95_08955 [Planctomycetes bacterium]|nr:hypothetical protein [Planctomycetota bacterium]